ncbi:MAG TPA: hypothetical protein VI322_04195 [Candidatus Saccharimonadia bacterium]
MQTPEQSSDPTDQFSRSAKLAAELVEVQPAGPTMTEVEAIHESRNQTPESREQLADLVELPVRGSVLGLYDRGVQTMEADANPESGRGVATIVINFNTLSPANQAAARELAAAEPGSLPGTVVLASEPTVDGYIPVEIQVPFQPLDEASAVDVRAGQLARRFVEQPMTWAGVSLDKLKADYGYGPDEELTVEDLAGEGWVQGDGGLLYRSQEQAEQSLRLAKTAE